MPNVKVLDCTLRDGGYVNDWKFGKQVSNGIISNLIAAKIDIVECGFIRNAPHDVDSTVYPSMECFSKSIAPKDTNVLYAIMIEQHNHVDDSIPEYDGRGADIIRVTFRKSEWNEAKQSIISLIKKGYKVCVQPVGTATYDDESLINLIKDVNEINPYAFYLVDTLGMMYRHDMRRFFYLIDNNLSANIALGFHSHNNLQLSFSNAQEMLRLNRKRNLIIDSSCYGMGRGVGNLPTELFVDYINNNIELRYSIIPIMNIIDKYLMPIYAKTRWGYDLPYFLSAAFKCHPNYAAYLMKKETLDIENIEKVLSLLPKDKRSEFDEKTIDELYFGYMNCFFNDADSVLKLREIIDDKEVLLLGPGPSIVNSKDIISKEITDKTFVISVNFISNLYKTDALFISNEKRLSQLIKNDLLSNKCIISTSNLKEPIANSIVFNYSSYLGEQNGADNAGAMAIRILKSAGVKKIKLAGFDGFEVDSSKNYCVDSYKKNMDYNSTEKKNSEISKQLKSALDGVNFKMITETKYEL